MHSPCGHRHLRVDGILLHLPQFPASTNTYNPDRHYGLTSWKYYDGNTHYHYCPYCLIESSFEFASHTGGTATCASLAECTVCGAPYGKPLDEHVYNGWTPAGDGSHASHCSLCDEPASVDCTLFTAEGIPVCPICGEYEGGVLPVADAHTTDALPYGTLVVRSGELPLDGAPQAITVTGSYGGKCVELLKPVSLTLPTELADFTLVSISTADGAEVRTEVPYTLENGMLSFTAEQIGLFLLVPAE